MIIWSYGGSPCLSRSLVSSKSPSNDALLVPASFSMELLIREKLFLSIWLARSKGEVLHHWRTAAVCKMGFCAKSKSHMHKNHLVLFIPAWEEGSFSPWLWPRAVGRWDADSLCPASLLKPLTFPCWRTRRNFISNRLPTPREGWEGNGAHFIRIFVDSRLLYLLTGISPVALHPFCSNRHSWVDTDSAHNSRYSCRRRNIWWQFGRSAIVWSQDFLHVGASWMQTDSCGCSGVPPFILSTGLFHALKPFVVKVSSVRFSISPFVKIKAQWLGTDTSIYVCSFNAKTTVVRPQLIYRIMHAFTCIT